MPGIPFNAVYDSAHMPIPKSKTMAKNSIVEKNQKNLSVLNVEQPEAKC